MVQGSRGLRRVTLQREYQGRRIQLEFGVVRSLFGWWHPRHQTEKGDGSADVGDIQREVEAGTALRGSGDGRLFERDKQGELSDIRILQVSFEELINAGARH
jgi:hypothetical protein